MLINSQEKTYLAKKSQVYIRQQFPILGLHKATVSNTWLYKGMFHHSHANNTANELAEGQTNRRTNRQNDKQTDEQTDRMTNRQMDKQTEKQADEQPGGEQDRC